jgi:DNA-binding winged helix-turn-helix (wHTH) protein
MADNPDNPAQIRGFAVYVGVDEASALAAGTTISELVDAVRNVVIDAVPGAESHAAVAYAPATQRGKNLDIVRLALREPRAVAELLPPKPDPADAGALIDLPRKRVVINGEVPQLTYKEFELLQYLVLREGVTVGRNAIIDSLWITSDVDRPNKRTIDVHVRRLRAKLEPFDNVVSTVRGIGYRFDRHPDVTVEFDTDPLPEKF